MKKKQKFYRFMINADLDENLRVFEEKVLNNGNETVISTAAANNIFIVTTEETHNPNRNLLLEDSPARDKKLI
jgi:hypothetical protein